MKLLLVLGSDESFNHIARCAPPGFELIRYRQVLKAMDNVDEIDPQLIIVSARDFPRHWKILVQFVRSRRSKEQCPVVILKPDNFSQEETAKALFLGVNGLVNETLDSAEQGRLKNILSRHAGKDEEQETGVINAEPSYRIAFLAVNPSSGAIINGEVKTISPWGLTFLPADASLIGDLNVDTELPECSLRVGGSILSPICKLTGAGGIISIDFLLFPVGERKILEQYVEELTR